MKLKRENEVLRERREHINKVEVSELEKAVAKANEELERVRKL